MPYIQQKDRLAIEDVGDLKTPGELNFYISEALAAYLENNTECYQTINDILGALEGAKLEFYRRVVVPYEDLKIKENGDVY